MIRFHKLQDCGRIRFLLSQLQREIDAQEQQNRQFQHELVSAVTDLAMISRQQPRERSRSRDRS